jgi:hypothetical protein
VKILSRIGDPAHQRPAVSWTFVSSFTERRSRVQYAGLNASTPDLGPSAEAGIHSTIARRTAMTTRTLLKRYPWYRKHFRAVNTLACFISMDVAEILRCLEGRVQMPGAVPRRSATSRKAA